MSREIILVTGACGQIGTALIPLLRELYGRDYVIASDLKASGEVGKLFENLDATDGAALSAIISKYGVTQIYHLAAVLSAKAEADPVWAWNLNMTSLLNILEAGRIHNLDKVFIPSSIAVFGETAPDFNTPQKTFLDPATIYGVSKVAGEKLSYYYHRKYNLDVRSLRYPGIVSYQSLPGGGTTDFAVDMYLKAVSQQNYICYLKEDTRLPMMYIKDALRASLELMEASEEKIKIRSSYNLAGFSLTPKELCDSINLYFPEFSCDFQPDFRQVIAESWPKSIDDAQARADWNWKPEFDLHSMTEDMVKYLS